jgi:3-dehydroquinate dehydratase-2|tara:strand:- start:2318 stop:2755 length:438 start_codon:yes stop_codon:yes gene_type:complete
MSKFMLLNGPNLNLLGSREPEIYGSTTLDEVEKELCSKASISGHQLLCYQSNAEHDLVEQIHLAKEENIKCIIFNPGAFTHSSIAIRDALSGVGIPFIEVHISNIYSREDFRQKSFLSDIAEGVVSGLGVEGYALALESGIKKFS